MEDHIEIRPSGLVSDNYTNHTATCMRHGKTWPEGDAFEDDGGHACRECAEAAYDNS